MVRSAPARARHDPVMAAEMKRIVSFRGRRSDLRRPTNEGRRAARRTRRPDAPSPPPSRAPRGRGVTGRPFGSGATRGPLGALCRAGGAMPYTREPDAPLVVSGPTLRGRHRRCVRRRTGRRDRSRQELRHDPAQARDVRRFEHGHHHGVREANGSSQQRDLRLRLQIRCRMQGWDRGALREERFGFVRKSGTTRSVPPPRRTASASAQDDLHLRPMQHERRLRRSGAMLVWRRNRAQHLCAARCLPRRRGVREGQALHVRGRRRAERVHGGELPNLGGLRRRRVHERPIGHLLSFVEGQVQDRQGLRGRRRLSYLRLRPRHVPMDVSHGSSDPPRVTEPSVSSTIAPLRSRAPFQIGMRASRKVKIPQ